MDHNTSRLIFLEMFYPWLPIKRIETLKLTTTRPRPKVSIPYWSSLPTSTSILRHGRFAMWFFSIFPLGCVKRVAAELHRGLGEMETALEFLRKEEEIRRRFAA